MLLKRLFTITYIEEYYQVADQKIQIDLKKYFIRKEVAEQEFSYKRKLQSSVNFINGGYEKMKSQIELLKADNIRLS